MNELNNLFFVPLSSLVPFIRPLLDETSPDRKAKQNQLLLKNFQL